MGDKGINAGKGLWAMKELMQERGLWAAVLLCLGGMAAGFPFYQMEAPLAAGSFLDYCKAALEGQALLFLIPIAGALPMGAAFVRESSSGFLKLYLTRTNRMEYIKRKTLQIYMGGFLPFFLAGAGMLALAFLLVYPLELQGAMDWGKLWQVARVLLRVSLSGGIVAGMAGIFAAVFMNYYMAYGLPFVCYYLLVILKERYFAGMYAMYPAEWVAAKQDWGTDGSGIWVFLGAFSAAVMLLHGLALSGRLREV